MLQATLERASERSIESYLENVIIDSVPEPASYGKLREPWQKRRDAALVPAVEFIAGLNKTYTGPRNFWFGLPKGSDKSSYIARLLNWLMAFCPRKNLRAYCGAKDAGQAGVILDAMTKEASLNPWLGKRIEIKRNKVEGKSNGAQLHILASDAEGIHGVMPDFVVVDEITHWQNKDLFDALFAGSGKRAGHCLFVVLTNAGFNDTWQRSVRDTAESEHERSWYFFEAPVRKKLATWLSDEVLAQTRKFITPTEARRLYDNEWLSLAEERAIFLPEDVDACIGPPDPPPPGAPIYLGLDYGEVNDPTAMAAVWYDGRILHVIECACLQGSRDNPVQIAEIEAWTQRKLVQYPNSTVILDKHQLVDLEQRLQKDGVATKRFEFSSGKLVFEMAECLRTMMIAKRIRFSSAAGLQVNGTTLADEFKRVISKRTQWGYKIDHDTKEHDDRVISVGMAALEAIKSTPDSPQRQLKKSVPSESKVLRPVGGGFKEAIFTKRNWFGTK